MKNPIKTEAATSLGLLLVRLSMGLYLLLAGVSKVHAGVGRFVSKSSGAIPDWLPQNAGMVYLHMVPFAEILIGALVMVGFFGRLSGLIGALMVTSFTIAVTGITDARLPFQTNVIFVTLFLLLFLAGSGRYSIDGFRGGSRV